MIKSANISAVGIIAEYNPFHSGHAYHIAKAKELSGAEYCIVIMSGDFVQRGAPAIFNKYIRAEMALSCGADLVLEMPSLFATASAEDFASCGVALLDKLGVVSHICFGSECGDIRALSEISDILAQEPESYTSILKEQLRMGASFPKAREEALSGYLRGRSSSAASGSSAERLPQILNSPNNILGIEYCKALSKRHSHITPVTISRAGSGYHDLNLTEKYASASCIRQFLTEPGGAEQIRCQIPEAVHPLLSESMPLFSEDFSALLNVTLLRLTESSEDLAAYSDVSDELAARIRAAALDFCSYEDRIQNLKTRQYTYTRISRALLHLMLGVKKEASAVGRSLDYAPYARVLGFKKDSVPLLSHIKRQSDIPLITKTADAKNLLTPDEYRMLQQDFTSSHIYGAIWSSRFQRSALNEFSRQIVLL